jgi:signal transduction histidine kinase
MSSRSTSPLFNQRRGNEPPILSKIVPSSSAVGKLPGVSLVKSDNEASCELCGRLNNLTHISNNDDPYRDATDMTLLGTAAHDLRHPATAILIYSELLLAAIGDTVSEEHAEWIDSIRSSSQFMLHLLDDTMDLARAQSGTVQLRTTLSTVADIVTRSVEMSYPLAAKKHMRLNLVQEGEPFRIPLDAVKISKVFNNLIENAIKYCQPGARIDVRISRTPDTVLVSVQDNGPGISPSDLKTLFIPYQRTLARALSEEPGTGLGLAIAKHIVDLHGGRIQVESQLDRGTTFYVSLPVRTHRTAKKS